MMAPSTMGELIDEPGPDVPKRLAWMAPKGLFEEPWDAFQTPVALDATVEWRRATDLDREWMQGWFEFYREFVASSDAQDWSSATFVLASAAPAPESERPGLGTVLPAFLVAATLHTRTPLWARVLRWQIDEAGAHAHSGMPELRTIKLPTWGDFVQQGITDEDALAISLDYPVAKQAIELTVDHPLCRAVGAYRGACSASFADAIPVLLWACLESLAAADKHATVSQRLIAAFASDVDGAEEDLHSLYRLREAMHSHGITHRRGGYRDPESQAFIESWFGKLKEREVWVNEYETLEDAQVAIGAYIDRYHHRPDSGLDYRSPREVADTWRERQSVQSSAG